MKALLYFFETELDKYTNTDYYIDCRGPPEKLLRDLRSSSERKKLGKYLSQSTNNPIKLIRAMSIANLLLIYSRDWFTFIEEHLTSKLSKDEWINQKFLIPYYQFLIRCSTTGEQYLQSVNLVFKKGQALQMLFYSINMLKLLFKVVEKMPFLGRYYKPKNTSVICSAVEIIAAQAQRLYAAFKHSLSEILYRRQIYLKQKEDEEIMRAILVDELTNINEEMKKLFLDKYFYPLGKGIGIKLFRPEEQTLDCEKTIKAIVSNHEETEREKKHEELEKTLFPGSGLVNWNFYEETLMSGPLLNITAKGNQPLYKELDQLAISQEDEEEEPEKSSKPIPKQEIGTSGKETNTGSVQMKSYQI